MIIEFIIIAFAIAILAFIANLVFSNYKKTSVMSFMESINLTGLPVVTFINNNKKFNFLLDTGSNMSILNSAVLKDAVYKETNKTGKVIGMEGVEKDVYYINMELEYKNNILKESFQVLDMEASFNSIKQESGVSICGILGNTFMQENKYVLDFDELIAYSKK